MNSKLQAEQDYLNANPGKTRADFIAWSNETVYTLVPGSRFGYGTVRDQLGKDFADGIASFLKATDEGAHFLFMAGNIDFGLQSTQDTLDTIQIPGVTAEMLLPIRNLGRTGAIRIDGISAESLAQAEAEDARLQKEAAFASLWNDVVAPNIAAATVPTVDQLKALLNV